MPVSECVENSLEQISDLLTKSNMAMLKVVVENEEQFRDFMSNYWTSVDKAFYAISRFREDKINKLNISSVEFIEMYSTDKVKALQTLLQYPTPLRHIKELEAQLHKRTISLTSLFDKHKKNPNLQLARLIEY